LPADSPVIAWPDEAPATAGRASNVSVKKAPQKEEIDTDVRWIAARIVEEAAEIVRERATVAPADVSRRRGKEMSQWRRERGAQERSDHTQYEDLDGESSWSANQASELLGISRAKKKQNK
jgi:hypothetical protein